MHKRHKKVRHLAGYFSFPLPSCASCASCAFLWLEAVKECAP